MDVAACFLHFMGYFGQIIKPTFKGLSTSKCIYRMGCFCINYNRTMALTTKGSLFVHTQKPYPLVIKCVHTTPCIYIYTPTWTVSLLFDKALVSGFCTEMLYIL